MGRCIRARSDPGRPQRSVLHDRPKLTCCADMPPKSRKFVTSKRRRAFPTRRRHGGRVFSRGEAATEPYLHRRRPPAAKARTSVMPCVPPQATTGAAAPYRENPPPTPGPGPDRRVPPRKMAMSAALPPRNEHQDQRESIYGGDLHLRPPPAESARRQSGSLCQCVGQLTQMPRWVSRRARRSTVRQGSPSSCRRRRWNAAVSS